MNKVIHKMSNIEEKRLNIDVWYNKISIIFFIKTKKATYSFLIYN